MNLGIIVVYLFDANAEYLLDLHLSGIRKCTDVPHTIYGCANRLDLQARRKLSEHPEVRQCDVPSTDLRGHLEHAYYLNHLAEIAIREGATHIAALHLDSFPVCPGWARKLKSLTDQTGSCVALDICYTACFFFERDFYLRHRPKFDISIELSKQFKYVRFTNKYKLIDHSATPYLYTCYINHLDWHILKSSSGESLRFGDVFGGLIFHFRSAVSLTLDCRIAKKGVGEIKFRKKVVAWITFLGKHLSTYGMREWIRKSAFYFFFRFLEKWLAGQREWIDLGEMRAAKAELGVFKAKFIENPESYLLQFQNSAGRSDAIQRVGRRRSPSLDKNF